MGEVLITIYNTGRYFIYQLTKMYDDISFLNFCINFKREMEYKAINCTFGGF